MVFGIAKTCRTMPELKDKTVEVYGKVPMRYTLLLARTSRVNLVKPRHAAALASVVWYGLRRGEIDLDIVIITVVSIFVLFGVVAWFYNGSQPNDGPFTLPHRRARACWLVSAMNKREMIELRTARKDRPASQGISDGFEPTSTSGS